MMWILIKNKEFVKKALILNISSHRNRNFNNFSLNGRNNLNRTTPILTTATTSISTTATISTSVAATTSTISTILTSTISMATTTSISMASTTSTTPTTWARQPQQPQQNQQRQWPHHEYQWLQSPSQQPQQYLP
ncbi:unnamed protein product [Rhizophagus irregularis]|nr:unnamed protein product [Rhizophagus irregularis]